MENKSVYEALQISCVDNETENANREGSSEVYRATVVETHAKSGRFSLKTTCRSLKRYILSYLDITKA